MSEIEIRTARPDDRDEVVALLERTKLPPDGIDEQFGEPYAVAVADGRIVGAAGVEVYGDAGLLRSVAVDPAWQGHGLGQRLTEDRIRWAAGRGLDTVFLMTNTAAGYFPRLGFTPVPREQVPDGIRGSLQFASVCPSTAAVMALRLEAQCATP